MLAVRNLVKTFTGSRGERHGRQLAVDEHSSDGAEGERLPLPGPSCRANPTALRRTPRRPALAGGLVLEPPLLLLDEPLSNLDAKLREDMRFELKRLQRDLGITGIYVTHDQLEALAMSNRVAVMRDGKIEQVGAPRAVYEHPRSRFVADFIGT